MSVRVIDTRDFLKGLLLANGAVLLAGPTGLFAKTLSVPIGVMVWGRSFFAALCLLVYLLLRRQPLTLPPGKAMWGPLASGALLAIHWLTFFYGIQLSNVAVGVLTFSTFPLFTTLIEPLVFKERLRPIDIITAAVAFCGISLIVPTFELSHHITQGAAWGTVSGFLYAVYAVLNKKLVVHTRSSQLTFLQNATAALLTTPALLWLTSPISMGDWLQLLLLGCAFTAGLQVLFIASLRHIKAQLLGIITTLEPLYSIVLAMLLLHEFPAMRTWIGGTVLMGAVLLAVLKAPKAHACESHQALENNVS